MKPAQLIPYYLATAVATLAGTSLAQSPAPESEPVAAAPAAPPTPLPPAPPQGAPAPVGKLVISAPAVPPATQRAGYHVHDGFYLRLGAGVGGSHINVSADGPGASDFKVGGPGLALNLWIGGTPWRGIALGGMAALQGIGDSNTVVNGNETHEDMSAGYLYLGPFIDAFPDPMRGLHVGGSLGLVGVGAQGSGAVLEKTYKVKDYNAGGLGASAWVGYMGFVGPEFSLGGLLQLTLLSTGKKEENAVERKASGYALSLSFTALYH